MNDLPILPTLGNRLKILRQRKGSTQLEVSEAVRVTSAAVSAWERDVDVPVRENILALASYYGVPVDYLYGDKQNGFAEDEGPALSSEDVAHISQHGEHAGTLPYGGIVEAGTFKPADLLNQSGDIRRVPIAPIAQYARARQAAYEVRGDSMDLLGLVDGMWAVGVNYWDYVEVYGRGVRNEQLVVVRQTRFQGSEVEMTIKEVHLYKDRTELVPRSRNKGHKTLIIPAIMEERDQVVEIAAVVAWAGWTYPL